MENSSKWKDFCSKAAQKFMIDETELVKFTNDFFAFEKPIPKPLNITDIYNTLERIERSASNSRSNSVTNTPRITASTPVAHGLHNFKLDTSSNSSQLVKSTKKRVKPEEKINKCKGVFKSGEKKGQVCGIPCIEEYCSKHTPSSSSASATSTNSQIVIEKENTNAISSTNDEPKRKLQKKTPQLNKQTKIDELINKRRDQINITKIEVNGQEYFIHQETQLLYSPLSGAFYGKQRADGSIDSLNANDVELCKMNNFKYTLPPNLGKNSDTNQTGEEEEKVTGLEDPADDYEDISEDED